MKTTEQNFLEVSSETTASGVSWASIFAGASAAASLSLILLVLGIGFGFPAISPWFHNGSSATAIGLTSILWLSFSQIAASGLGGYLAGRLRIKWVTVHTDEVYFRDTAHGFLAWAIATLATAALLGAVVTDVVSIGVSASTPLASNAFGMVCVGEADANPGSKVIPSVTFGTISNCDSWLGYRVDSLFRSNQLSLDTTEDSRAARLEISRIFVNGLRAHSLPKEDEQYLAQIIAQRTGLSPLDADKRVSDVFNKAHAEIENAEQNARQVADHTHKVAAYSTLWMFIALLSGAFVASLAATFGGRKRDRVIHSANTSFS